MRYSAPRSLDDAVALLAADDARVLAGGTDLLIQLRAGTCPSRHLIDVKRIAELATLDVDASGALRIGAAVPCWRLADDARVRRSFPGLAEATALIGSTQIQSRATIAGNLCNGSPAADTTPALAALDAVGVVVGPAGRREVPVASFVTAPGKTVLGRGELLVELRVPAPSAHSADAYQRFIPRNEMDIAVVGVAASITRDGARCSAARIALGAVGPTVLLAEDAARALVGGTLDDAAIARAAAAAMAAARPITDMRAPADYRREITGVLTRRVVAEAARRALQGA
ncbi:xanthine dehydrogenase family protein subunit M [Candidatus Binatia bacterium]|nr:xanthine dehydrogenase family protein subunit M [Candidatus Binatia bacterium]